MGGALKAISKIAGPIMQIASMFTPAGAIMGLVSKGMDFLKNIGGALKSIAPKAAANIDAKLNKVQSFAQNAIGKANQFLTGLGNAAASLGNTPQPANPAPALQLPIIGGLL